VSIEVIVDDPQRWRSSLAADERAEPRAEEEYPAMLLDPRERIEGGGEVGQRKGALIRIVEGS